MSILLLFATPIINKAIIQHHSEIKERQNQSILPPNLTPPKQLNMKVIDEFEFYKSHCVLDNRSIEVVINGSDAIESLESFSSEAISGNHKLGSYRACLAQLTLNSDDEFVVLNSTLQGINRSELNNYVEHYYVNFARYYFEKEYYFLGMAKIEQGLRRIRLIDIPNMKGVNDDILLANPMIIIDAFFPKNIGGNFEKAAVDDYSLSKMAIDILNNRFQVIANRNFDYMTPGLRDYSKAVIKFKEKEFKEASMLFDLAEFNASTEYSKDLSRFMSVRAIFWAVSYTHLDVYKRQV